MDAARGLGQLAAGLGQENFAADHFIEREPDGFGEITQMHRSGRLGDVGFLGGATDAAGGDQGPEKLELAEGDIHS